MTSAIAMARKGVEVTLYEHSDRVGKKLLSTGNGKCNISNTDRDLKHYHGDSKFIAEVFEKMPFDAAISFLTGLGIYTKNKNGYLYPNSEQAAAVNDVLRHALKRYGVKLFTETKIKSISPLKEGEGFLLITDKGRETCDKLVIAAGSKAAPKSGSDGSGYELAEALGHKVVTVLPALCALKSNDSACKAIAGVRTDALVRLFVDGRELARDRGEVQFTDYGISGIPVFQLSYLAVRAIYSKKKVRAVIDLMPELSMEYLIEYLTGRKREDESKTAAEFLIGMLNKNLALLIIKKSNLKSDISMEKVSEEEIKDIAFNIKELQFEITGYNSFDKAQICQGGVTTKELSSNLESCFHKGLFFAGEIIDVNGDCGGYNLTWAFCTGLLAAL